MFFNHISGHAKWKISLRKSCQLLTLVHIVRYFYWTREDNNLIFGDDANFVSSIKGQ